MATTRVTSPDTSSSAGEHPNVAGLSKNSPHPEEWTLPHEWNIEKREMYDVSGPCGVYFLNITFQFHITLLKRIDVIV